MKTHLATVVFALVAVTVSARSAASEDTTPRDKTAPVERIEARSPSGRVDIMIERWSTDIDDEALRATLVARETDKLLDVLQNGRHRLGLVQFPGRQGLGARARTRRAQPVLFAREVKTKTGRQIIIATDQWLEFADSRVQRPSREQEFTLIDMRFGEDGKGVGKLGGASGVTINRETGAIELENYGDRSTVLREVRSAKP